MKIGILSDLHEDVIRTREAIQLLKDAGSDVLVCLGDLIGVAIPYMGYLQSRNASEVINLIGESCDLVLIGNHDLYCIKKNPQSGSFSYPANWYELDYPTRFRMGGSSVWLHEENELSALISNEEKSYLETLPEYCIKVYDGVSILFSHRLYPDFAGSTKQAFDTSNDFNLHREFMKIHGCSVSFCGHSHKRRLSFNESEIIDRSFSDPFVLDEGMGCIVPCVANGTFPNGVTVFDTLTMTTIFLPLNTPLHTVPSWPKQ